MPRHTTTTSCHRPSFGGSPGQQRAPQTLPTGEPGAHKTLVPQVMPLSTTILPPKGSPEQAQLLLPHMLFWVLFKAAASIASGSQMAQLVKRVFLRFLQDA